MTVLAGAVAAWAQTTGSLLEVGAGCPEEDFARPTECPGWTVKDQLSHVVGVERWLLGSAEPAHTVPDLPHVHGEFGRRVEVAVDLRRGLPGRAVVGELAGVRRARLDALQDPGADPAAPAPSPLGGTLPLVDLVRLRTFDVWTHEQDVRRALDLPATLDTGAAATALAWVRRVLPRVVARGARVEPGRAVVLDVVGHGGFTDAVTVSVGADGKPVGSVLPEPPARPDAVLRMAAEAYLRRSCGRWSPAQTPVDVEGDRVLASAVVQALAVTP